MDGDFKIKNFINTEKITKIELEKLFCLADEIKSNKSKFSETLKGKVIATLFYEPSTRTRLSFESAIVRLGASVISTENAKENASASKGESLEDTIKIIQGYADAIIVRHFENDSAERAVKVATVPIINAGSGGAEHPTQAVLDVYTMRELKGKIDGLNVAIMGDLKYGRTAHSMIKLLSLYDNITVYGFGVMGLELPEYYKEFLLKRNVKYVECKTFNDIPKDIDIIYQTRVQKERIEDKNLKIDEFCLNKENFRSFSKNTLLMHPLPRIGEIDPELDCDERSVYFQQAHNGIPTRMALLKIVMENFYENK